MKLSLIVPVYNTAEYLEKCIRSAMGQTYRDMEIVCVDDGSTDGSGEILDRLAREDSRLAVLHQSNAGESAARNIGLDRATGEYIGFMDCDDWIEPKMYEILIGAGGKDADVVCGGWFEEFPDRTVPVGCLDRPEEEFGWQQLMYYLYKRDRYRAFGYMWDKVYRRELLAREDGAPLRFETELVLGGDILFLAQVCLNARKAVYVDQPLYHYRRRASSGTFSRNIRHRMGAIYAYERVIELLEQKGAWEETIAYAKRFLGYHCILIGETAIETGDGEGLREVQEYMRRYEGDYARMNEGHPERVERYRSILHNAGLKGQWAEDIG